MSVAVVFVDVRVDVKYGESCGFVGLCGVGVSR